MSTLPSLDPPPEGALCDACGDPLCIDGFCSWCYELEMEQRRRNQQHERHTVISRQEMESLHRLAEWNRGQALVVEKVRQWKERKEMAVSLESVRAKVLDALEDTRRLGAHYESNAGTGEVLENVGLGLRHSLELLDEEVAILKRAGEQTA